MTSEFQDIKSNDVVEESVQEDEEVKNSQPRDVKYVSSENGIVQLSFKRRNDDVPIFAYTNGSFQNDVILTPMEELASPENLVPAPPPYENWNSFWYIGPDLL